MDTSNISGGSHKGSLFIVLAVVLLIVIAGVYWWYTHQKVALPASSQSMESSVSQKESAPTPKIEGLGSEIFDKATNPLLDKLPGGDLAPTPDPLKGVYNNPFE